MKNGVFIRTTQDINNNGSELYFDFYDLKGEFVGYLIVSDLGEASWSIINLYYEKQIKEIIYEIVGEEGKIRLHGETTYIDRNRWRNACIFVINRGLVLNFSSGESQEEEKTYDNGRRDFTKKNRYF